MKRFAKIAAIAAFTGMSFGAQAADQYVFDKTHTSILFFISHLGFSDMQGEFLGYEGGFVFDQDNPANSSVEVTIDVASVDTDVPKLDDHLKAADFFNVAKFPTASFKSTGIEVTGDNTGVLTGDFTLMGMTRPLVLDVTFNKAANHPFAKDVYVAGFSATATLDRTEWGLSTYAPAIGSEVTLRIETEGHRVAN